MPERFRGAIRIRDRRVVSEPITDEEMVVQGMATVDSERRRIGKKGRTDMVLLTDEWPEKKPEFIQLLEEDAAKFNQGK